MKAIVYRQNGLPIADPQSLYETDLPKPQPGPRDLLVKIRAISVNPVDTKVRNGAPTDEPRILGWDAVGEVEAVGAEVSLFQPGDEVFYAGSIVRPGSYAEYSLVDERIAGRKPQSLSDADAAALPLTSLTAWELLFDRLEVKPDEDAALLIVGAGGGVGSIMTQLARKLTGLTVIGTASRPETAKWVKSLGAHHVIDHSRPLADELKKIGIEQVRYVASLTHTDQHFDQIVEVLAPQGRMGVIDDPQVLDVMPLKRKAISLHWELMFTRAIFQTADMQRQHDILQHVSRLIDDGTLRSTLGDHYGPITADNLRKAHALIESGKARGKIVLAGF
ncbi:zinc-binding alcohol dehydrogenase family protein [Serratia rubidaea]|uniref:zinc-binding alcohol dehydrogenase family protein n=1 Tax=Serratia rubidaea TaxID=61652 RepID=UPI001782E471|nr:zinc-binding alcohol dehydrogenase family protein [Serratia rubidaea]MBD8454115.1 zinc-binding alcohol dehydrogenase family protein [Serratia rubidaea]MDC6108496.1 zinc-binding alcohol dehydrogenase family protein [Serratia rubidaea]MDK1705472.1 zinc-binding alcohol dehydrogenase family protein [Serratia rubidaea]UJD78274.1 zinc-binding alcohol dehydrogenase family protein [Serratia rubidaea]UJD82825.1 zinc-binding alcohol dehydrogenase family protein [Serratia rubidaea]